MVVTLLPLQLASGMSSNPATIIVRDAIAHLAGVEETDGDEITAQKIAFGDARHGAVAGHLPLLPRK